MQEYLSVVNSYYPKDNETSPCLLYPCYEMIRMARELFLLAEKIKMLREGAGLTQREAA